MDLGFKGSLASLGKTTTQITGVSGKKRGADWSSRPCSPVHHPAEPGDPVAPQERRRGPRGETRPGLGCPSLGGPQRRATRAHRPRSAALGSIVGTGENVQQLAPGQHHTGTPGRGPRGVTLDFLRRGPGCGNLGAGQPHVADGNPECAPWARRCGAAREHRAETWGERGLVETK